MYFASFTSGRGAAHRGTGSGQNRSADDSSDRKRSGCAERGAGAEVDSEKSDYEERDSETEKDRSKAS